MPLIPDSYDDWRADFTSHLERNYRDPDEEDADEDDTDLHIDSTGGGPIA